MTLARVAVAFALLTAVGTHGLSTCMGWDSSAQARMECCERSAECGDPSMASACCAAGESDDNAQVNAVLLATPPGPIAFVAPPPTTQPPQPRQLHFVASFPHAFRNAVLLI